MARRVRERDRRVATTAMFYSLLGRVVWYGLKLFLRRKYGPTLRAQAGRSPARLVALLGGGRPDRGPQPAPTADAPRVAAGPPGSMRTDMAEHAPAP